MIKQSLPALVLAAAVAAPLAAFAASGPGFERADQNADGRVSQSEFYMTQDHERHEFFFRADRDNDLSLTAKEFKSVDVFLDRSRNRSGE